MRKKILYILICIICVSISGCSRHLIQVRDAGREAILHNEMSYRELAAVLEELGIRTVSEKTLEDMENNWKKIPAELYESFDKMAMLLAAVGRGNYNFETGEWTPSSNQIYSFDVEAFDIGNMYTLFLQGIAAISMGELEFTNITEDGSKADYEQGIGRQTVTFYMNGKKHIFQAEVNYDWYDTKILDNLNQILREEKNDRQLFFMGDGYQECIVFYCTEEWAAHFTEKTGCKLYNKTK